MGYNLYITRKKSRTEDTDPDITAAEWLTYVPTDPQLCLDPDNGPYFIQIKNKSEFSEAWLDGSSPNGDDGAG